MKTKDVETDVGSTDLASYILAVTEQLKRERKFAAAHGYVSVLHSFQDFAGHCKQDRKGQRRYAKYRKEKNKKYLRYTHPD